MTLSPPVVNDWLAGAKPQASDLNTYVRDTFSFLANPPVLRATATVATTVPNTTWTGIQLDSVLEDTYSGWTSPGSGANNYTAQVGGWYAVSWTIYCTLTPGKTARAGLQLTIDGVTSGPFDYSEAVAGSLSPWGWDCYDEIYLEAGDQLFPYFEQLSGGSVNTAAGSALEIVWISE